MKTLCADEGITINLLNEEILLKSKTEVAKDELNEPPPNPTLRAQTKYFKRTLIQVFKLGSLIL